MLTTFDKSLVAVVGGMLATLGTLFPVITPSVQTLVIALVTAVLVYFIPNTVPVTPVPTPVVPVSNTAVSTTR